jgi:arabinan endo-1,5-alpha-L-arabinosidase
MRPRVANSAVIGTNFMDPSVIELNGGYYAFAGANGNPAGTNVQVASSPDFSSWTLESGYDALPVLGAWAANPGHVWSPDINQLVRT